MGAITVGADSLEIPEVTRVVTASLFRVYQETEDLCEIPVAVGA